MSLIWHSCMANYAILVEGDPPDSPPSRYRSVFVFQADSDIEYEDLWAKAIEVARSREADYIGGTPAEPRRVAWRLINIETIDLLGDTITDGREVYGEPADAPEGNNWTIDTKFTPEADEPGMSGV